MNIDKEIKKIKTAVKSEKEREKVKFASYSFI